MIGEQGVEWEALTKGEAKKAPFLDIEITGGSAEIAANEAKSKKRENALALLLKRQDLTMHVNPQWIIKEVLKVGEYEEEDIRMALSKEDVNLELMSEAAQAIQMILRGKEPKLNRGANVAFMQKIVDYAYDNDIDIDKYKKLVTYALRHKEIALQNMARMAGLQGMILGQNRKEEKPVIKPTEQITVEEPVAGSPAGTMKTSQEASNILQGKFPVPNPAV